MAADAFRAAGDWEGLGRVTARIGSAHSLRGTPQEGIAQLTTLLEVLDRSSASASTQVALYEVLGPLLFAAGRYDASLAASEQAAALARAGGDEHPRMRADGHRLNFLQMLGRLGDALLVGREVLPLAEAVGDLVGMLLVHRDLAYIHALQGAVALGWAAIERALAVAEQLGDPGAALAYADPARVDRPRGRGVVGRPGRSGAGAGAEPPG